MSKDTAVLGCLVAVLAVATLAMFWVTITRLVQSL